MVQETSQKKKGRAAGIILTVIAVVILLPVCRYVIQKLGLAVPPVVLQLVVFVAAGIVIAKFVRDTYVYHYCIDEKTLHIYRSVGGGTVRCAALTHPILKRWVAANKPNNCCRLLLLRSVVVTVCMNLRRKRFCYIVPGSRITWRLLF